MQAAQDSYADRLPRAESATSQSALQLVALPFF